MKLRWESQDGNWDIFGISFVGTTSNWEAACLIKLLISILYKCYSILSGCASGFYLSGTPKTSVYHISELSISNWAQVWWCFWCLSNFGSFEQLGVLDSKHLYRLQTLPSSLVQLGKTSPHFVGILLLMPNCLSSTDQGFLWPSTKIAMYTVHKPSLSADTKLICWVTS